MVQFWIFRSNKSAEVHDSVVVTGAVLLSLLHCSSISTVPSSCIQTVERTMFCNVPPSSWWFCSFVVVVVSNVLVALTSESGIPNAWRRANSARYLWKVNFPLGTTWSCTCCHNVKQLVNSACNNRQSAKGKSSMMGTFISSKPLLPPWCKQCCRNWYNSSLRACSSWRWLSMDKALLLVVELALLIVRIPSNRFFQSPRTSRNWDQNVAKAVCVALVDDETDDDNRAWRACKNRCSGSIILNYRCGGGS